MRFARHRMMVYPMSVRARVPCRHGRSSKRSGIPAEHSEHSGEGEASHPACLYRPEVFGTLRKATSSCLYLWSAVSALKQHTYHILLKGPDKHCERKHETSTCLLVVERLAILCKKSQCRDHLVIWTWGNETRLENMLSFNFAV